MYVVVQAVEAAVGVRVLEDPEESDVCWARGRLQEQDLRLPARRVEVLLLLLAYALMIDWLMDEVPVPVARRAFLRLARRRGTASVTQNPETT